MMSSRSEYFCTGAADPCTLSDPAVCRVVSALCSALVSMPASRRESYLSTLLSKVEACARESPLRFAKQPDRPVPHA